MFKGCVSCNISPSGCALNALAHYDKSGGTFACSFESDFCPGTWEQFESILARARNAALDGVRCFTTTENSLRRLIISSRWLSNLIESN